MCSAHAAEVEVDAETGKVTVKRIVAAADMGRPINPINCLQQTEGGTLHAMGTATLEEVLLDRKGRMVNPNFHDYKIPTAMDAPEILPILVEAPHREGPFGAKGIGEIITTSVAAAISNAINDAVGIRIKELPLNALRVLAALEAAGLAIE
jgi:CO/xanthine dehydrogenase Mo-binding subunit